MAHAECAAHPAQPAKVDTKDPVHLEVSGSNPSRPLVARRQLAEGSTSSKVPITK